MRKGRIITLALAVTAVALWAASGTMAFHDGGVAHCNGCHTMHNSENGQLVDADSPGGNPWLLRDATPSDVCLDCHATRLGVTFSADPLAPGADYGGGDFVFLLEDNINDGHAGASNPILGEKSGHSIVAPSKNVAADSTVTTAPGGTFPAAALGCSSCHDPHGNANFRLLYGAASVQDGLFTFTRPAPVADGLLIFAAPESNTNHTAYKSGMSDWCGNCHGDFHNQTAGLIHPSGQAIGGLFQTYNLYNGTDDITGGAAATAYLAAVPFEDPAMTTSSTAGPTGTSQVSCITCHKAHATSGPQAGRWDFNVTFLHEDGVESGSYQIPDPYASLNQRSLCNKCHAKDVDDAPFVP